MRLIVAATAALIAGICTKGAYAASFDCAKAATPMERAICADKDLSDEDKAMADAYRNALSMLSLQGRQALRESQRRFLTYVTVKCDADELRNGGKEAEKRYGWCLKVALNDRIALLKRSVTVAGGRRFLSVTHYRARAVTDTDGNPPESYAVEEVVTSLNIDAPATAAERAWNVEAIRRQAEGLKTARNCCDDNSPFETNDSDNVSVSTTLVSASPDLIVSVVTGGHFVHHSPHALETQNDSGIWSLRLGRALTASDILDDRKHWQEKLLPVAQAHLKAAIAGQPLDELSMDFADARRWQVKADGIHIVYTPYELGSYLSEAETVLSWSTLKPYLRRDLPFRPQDLQSVGGVVY